MAHPIELMRTALEFQALGLDPVLFQVGPFALRWYSLAYIGGILLGWWYLNRLLGTAGAPMSRRHADNLVTWATLGIILGGRLAYVIFYEPEKYLGDPAAILRLWEGGMSFHGGVIGVTLAIILFARSNGLDWLRIHDYVACVVPIGLGLGRIANFINGELWGRPTDAPWGIIFPGAGPEPRHPSQLYEAVVEGAVLFFILWWLFHRTNARYYPGRLVGTFLLGYGSFRFIVEFFREPDRQLGTLDWGLTMGQTLCLPMILGGAYLIATSAKRRQRVEPIAGPSAQQ